MQDEKIVALYWDRNEAAIEETKSKYEHYLFNFVSFTVGYFVAN